MKYKRCPHYGKHFEEDIKTDKLQALREYFFLIETQDVSISRLECHEKIEQLWNIEKDNKYLEYILHNLDIMIKYPINRELEYKEKIKFENRLKKLLDDVKDWKYEDKNIDVKKLIKRGKTSGEIK